MSQSTPSPIQSQRSSPSQSSQRVDGHISIETLISWLIAAKRSLSSINHVHRATNILTEARSIIESTTAVIARTKYLRKSLGSQFKILRGIQYELELAAQSVKVDIQTKLNQLEVAEKRLTKDVEVLQQTRVQEAFRPGEAYSQNASGEDVTYKNTLHDFVDGRPVDDVKQNTYDAMTKAHEAQSLTDQSILTLEDMLQNIDENLNDRTATSSSTQSDFQHPKIPLILKSLENHAREMAESLESLVKHFDLCVTAIKHTEGGGAAVVQTFVSEDLPEGVDVEAFETPVHPISNEERAEMLVVLENDAIEVDDVVTELSERVADMETQLEQVMIWRRSSITIHNDVATAFKLMEEVSQKLPGHITASSQFAKHWEVQKTRIVEGIAGMEELCEVYDNFLIAYDGMIVEAARRRTVRKKMEKIVLEAQSQLDQLYEDDLNERDHFRSEQGDFLPSDIWHGLDSLPARFGFQRHADEGGNSIPDLPKEIVAGALKRLKSVMDDKQRIAV